MRIPGRPARPQKSPLKPTETDEILPQGVCVRSSDTSWQRPQPEKRGQVHAYPPPTAGILPGAEEGEEEG